MMGDSMDSITKCVGKRLIGAKLSDDDFWFIFDDNSILIFKYPSFVFSCVGCEEKKKLVVE